MDLLKQLIEAERRQSKLEAELAATRERVDLIKLSIAVFAMGRHD